MTDFLGTSDGLELVKAFMAVKDAKAPPSHRRSDEGSGSRSRVGR